MWECLGSPRKRDGSKEFSIACSFGMKCDTYGSGATMVPVLYECEHLIIAMMVNDDDFGAMA